MNIDKAELIRYINECVLELLEKEDESLIAVMKEYEKNNGVEITEDFVEETKAVLMEHLGVEPKDKEEPRDLLKEEVDSMMKQIGFKRHEDE